MQGFGVGEVLAVRTFRLGAAGGLYPLYDDRPWQPGVNTATCKRGRDPTPPPPVPAGDCRCGFYAYGNATWIVAPPPAVAALAVVALWGTLEVATRGVRAEHGELRSLWLHRRVPGRLVDAVRERYPGIEVVRERDALLHRHPLTALDGYRRPRPTGRPRRRVTWLLGVLASLVLLIGCWPAGRLVVAAPGAILGTTALAVVCATTVVGLGHALVGGRYRRDRRTGLDAVHDRRRRGGHLDHPASAARRDSGQRRAVAGPGGARPTRPAPPSVALRRVLARLRQHLD